MILLKEGMRMIKPKKIIPHMQQSSVQRNCGAACLAMLMQAYRKPGKLAEITEQIGIEISGGVFSCRTNLMLRYAASKKINACAVSVRNVRTTIETCLLNGIDVVISYHPDLSDPGGHFSVVTGSDSDGVFLNDPLLDLDSTKEKVLSYADLDCLMKPVPGYFEIVKENTLLLFSPKKDQQPLVMLPPAYYESEPVPVFSSVMDQVCEYLDPAPEGGEWVEISSTPSPLCKPVM